MTTKQFTGILLLIFGLSIALQSYSHCNGIYHSLKKETKKVCDVDDESEKDDQQNHQKDTEEMKYLIHPNANELKYPLPKTKSFSEHNTFNLTNIIVGVQTPPPEC